MVLKKMVNSIFKNYSESIPNMEQSEKSKIIEKNRAILKSVPNWLSEDVKKSSYFAYGVPDNIMPLLDLEIGNEITYTDLIVYLSRSIKNVNYLELGVSVGKNFYQLAKQFEDAVLTGFDIENPNPVLEEKFSPVSRTTWKTQEGSIRKEDSYLIEYTCGTNKIKYLAADIWDENSWSKLKGNKYSIIFSDALHDPKALIWEYEMILKYELLDDNFMIFWDDLNHGLENSFFEIASKMKSKYGLRKNNIRFIKVNGWLGKNYPLKHDVGIVSNLF